MLRGVVSRPFHLAAKQAKPDAFCWTPFRGSAVCIHQPSSDVLISDHHEVHRQVESLSARNLQTYLRAARSQSLDLDSAVEEYKRSRHMDVHCPLSKDSLNALDGRHLDAIFNVNQKSESFLYQKTYDPPFKKLSPNLPDGCVIYCSGGGTTPSPNDSDLPNADTLNNVQGYLLEVVSLILAWFTRNNIFIQIPTMLNSRVDPSAYSNDIVLVNSFNPAKPVVIEGTSKYFLYMSKMRGYIHLRYAKARLSVVRSWQDVNKGTVRVQWRLSTISQLQAMMFWRFSFWNVEDSFVKYAKNLEAVSTFHINKEGLIYRHVVDRVIPDSEETVKASMNPLEKLVKKAAPSML
ncbi:hypothetical protein CAPTEDRAFT_191001 [Capitella teleta]|uniref:Uncharacterized protein n=1 Tax=Capitella teleta TaxID=283909 RepID=R7TLS1_CAPTE|nr:hypothetical protein CAPTEDRAFT_191001 [Capitella teleta]|eukprot:ELT94768.1 hypothetical protein CAPTEDRAFT_191001 [Capitella teleta]